jgi:hypothetical protein
MVPKEPMMQPLYGTSHQLIEPYLISDLLKKRKITVSNILRHAHILQEAPPTSLSCNMEKESDYNWVSGNDNSIGYLQKIGSGGYGEVYKVPLPTPWPRLTQLQMLDRTKVKVRDRCNLR